MTVQRATTQPPPRFRLSIDSFAEYVGVTALASAGLLLAGVASTGAYLAAWRIPVWMVELDPISTALRAETVLYTAALMAAVVVALVIVRRLSARAAHRWHMAYPAAVSLLLVAPVGLVAVGIIGPALAVAGAVLLAIGRRLGWFGDLALTVAFAVVATVSAHFTGLALGTFVRDNTAWQTPVVLTTQAPVGGLAGGVEEGEAWRYEDLYVVYRDSDAIYVSTPGAGPIAWMVTELNLRSLTIGASGS